MTEAIATDPVNNDITREEGDFYEIWHEIGKEVKQCLIEGPADTTWCNVVVTHDSDTIGRNELHRTVALNNE